MGGSGAEGHAFVDGENGAGWNAARGRQDKAAGPPAALPVLGAKRDFFGRVIADAPRPLGEGAQGDAGDKGRKADEAAGRKKVWVTFHEGLNNAVRKPISLEEFLTGL